MRFVSTRGGAEPVTFSRAMEMGLAPDGGLFVPESFPSIDTGRFTSAATLADMADAILRPFLSNDPLEPHLGPIIHEALDFQLPLVHLEGLSVLELFHGPTAAFKDVGARFMASAFARCASTPRTVLVATSGDTGSAVAAAFHRRPDFGVVILFPEAGVSSRQRHQLTCFGDNVRAYSVGGSFDDCQRMLKAALANSDLVVRLGLTTANSINVARLLPQVVYHAVTALHYLWDRGVEPTLVVPSGNVGNALAALWARRLGFPIAHIVLATNANRPVPDFLATGRWEPRPSMPTLANAMDVGDPSNMERVFHLFPDHDQLREQIESVSVDDATIEEVIRRHDAMADQVWDPHTATAVHAVEALDLENAVVVGTAHPAKFEAVVEPLVGHPIDVPPALQSLLTRPTAFARLEPDASALIEVLG